MKNRIQFINFKLGFTLILVFSFSCTLDNSEKSDSNYSENESAENLAKKSHEIQKALTQSFQEYVKVVEEMKTYVETCNDVKDSVAARAELLRIIELTEFEDSIVLSFIDTNHQFVYSFNRVMHDPANLVDTYVTSIRTRDEIVDLNTILEDSNLHFFEPINLVEGYPGLPLNFGVFRDGVRMGYVATLINLRGVLARIYKDHRIADSYVLWLRMEDGPDIDRFKVHDEMPTYNKSIDSEYHQNFRLPESAFHFNTIHILDLEMEIGIALKSQESKK